MFVEFGIALGRISVLTVYIVNLEVAVADDVQHISVLRLVGNVQRVNNLPTSVHNRCDIRGTAPGTVESNILRVGCQEPGDAAS
jgi:hypothetical protein